MMKMVDRYHNDPAFHALVDMLTVAIEQGNFTPTEVREAAMLAQIRFEERNPRPTVFSLEDIRRGIV